MDVNTYQQNRQLIINIIKYFDIVFAILLYTLFNIRFYS